MFFDLYLLSVLVSLGIIISAGLDDSAKFSLSLPTIFAALFGPLIIGATLYSIARDMERMRENMLPDDENTD